MKREWMAMGARPPPKLLRQLQRPFVIADEIVVDNENRFARTQLKQSLELGDHLRGMLGPGLSSVDSNDVAEFTLERTSARKLHRHTGVALQLQQIKAGDRRAGDIWFLSDIVE